MEKHESWASRNSLCFEMWSLHSSLNGLCEVNNPRLRGMERGIIYSLLIWFIFKVCTICTLKAAAIECAVLCDQSCLCWLSNATFHACKSPWNLKKNWKQIKNKTKTGWPAKYINIKSKLTLLTFLIHIPGVVELK